MYADIDILLTSNLDEAIDDDVGFMLPFDYVSKDLCYVMIDIDRNMFV